MVIKRTFIALAILIFGICSYSFSQTGVSNVNFQTTADNRIEISYDLTGYAASARFTVSVRVSLDNGRSFSLIPKALTGDVGPGISPGRNKTITWDVFRDMPVLISDEMVIQVLAKQETPPTPSRPQPAPARPRSDLKMPKIKIPKLSDDYGELRLRLSYSDIPDEQSALRKIRGLHVHVTPYGSGIFAMCVGGALDFWQTSYGKWDLSGRVDVGPQLKILGLRTYLTASAYLISWPRKDSDDSIFYIYNIYGMNYGLEYRLFLSERWGLSFCYEVSSFIGQTANIGYKQFGLKDHSYKNFIVGFYGVKLRN